MARITGLAVSRGVAIGRVFALDQTRQRIPKRHVSHAKVDKELERFDVAIAASIAELEDVRDRAHEELGAEPAKVFGFHLGMLADKALLEPVRAMVRDERVTAEHSVYAVFREWENKFASMGDTAFTTKADDMRDLSSRIISHLIGKPADRLAKLDHEAIVIAADITPSQAAAFDPNKIIAFATDTGGMTSHTAIVARALGIPAVVGCKALSDEASAGSMVIVDGDRGIVIVDPEDDEILQYQGYMEQYRIEQLSLRDVARLPAETLDGTHIELLANIEFPIEAATCAEFGAEGVGLYRTEFLYLTSAKEPTEEDHYQSYRQCIELLNGLPLTIRTVDLGSDKLTQLQMEVPERNPALGLRSIRYCLARLPMFKTQLRAALRASSHGPIKLMFPMVTNIREFMACRSVVNDVKEDLAEHGIAYDDNIPLGVMIEVPSAALQADVFGREVDFFSVGTNDLVQYTLAVDRTNERVQNMYSPHHPAVLKLIKQVTKAGNRHEKPVSCCGESASDTSFAILLMGLGVRKLSVTPSSIPLLKRLVRSVSIEQCEKIARKAVWLDSDTEVAAMVRDRVRKIIPEGEDARSEDPA